MEPRRTSARRAGLVALTALLALAASACSGGTGLVGTPPAATVNDTRISQATVDQMVQGSKKMLEAQIDEARSSAGADPAATQELEAQIVQARAPFERGEYTYSTTAGSQALTELIISQLYEEAVAEAGGKITDEDRAQAKEQLSSRTGYKESGKVVRDTYLRGGAANYALQRLVPKDLQDALTGAAAQYEAQLQQVYEQQKRSFDQVCSYVLQTQDEAAATAAADRIRAGEDAAAVAGEVMGAEAAPQCDATATIAQAFGEDASLAKGSILGPLDTGGGFVVLVVDSTKTASFDEVREQIAASVQDQFTAQAQADIDAWVRKQIDGFAHVTVDPRFGTWDAEALEVVPPEAPPTTTTTVAGATTVPVPVVAGS
ncbi:MAG: hypothetical protein JWO77_57 [Ilumatobacteraceae bacterium]|nr:hypothetical protein [Ilumatobacteraceae bacterium]